MSRPSALPARSTGMALSAATKSALLTRLLIFLAIVVYVAVGVAVFMANESKPCESDAALSAFEDEDDADAEGCEEALTFVDALYMSIITSTASRDRTAAPKRTALSHGAHAAIPTDALAAPSCDPESRDPKSRDPHSLDGGVWRLHAVVLRHASLHSHLRPLRHLVHFLPPVRRRRVRAGGVAGVLPLAGRHVRQDDQGAQSRLDGRRQGRPRDFGGGALKGPLR